MLICCCRRMQIQSTTFRPASTNMDSMVNGNVNVHVAKQMKVCKMEETDKSIVWRDVIGLVAIKTFLEAHGDVFDLEEQGESGHDEAQIDHAQHRSKPKISGRLTIVHHEWWCVAEEWTGTLRSQCGLLVHLEGFTQVGIHPLGQSCRVGMDP